MGAIKKVRRNIAASWLKRQRKKINNWPSGIDYTSGNVIGRIVPYQQILERRMSNAQRTWGEYRGLATKYLGKYEKAVKEGVTPGGIGRDGRSRLIEELPSINANGVVWAAKMSTEELEKFRAAADELSGIRFKRNIKRRKARQVARRIAGVKRTSPPIKGTEITKRTT